MKKLIYVTILSALTFSACEKSKTGGCIDPAAYNYESFADYDDGSCLYILGCTDPLADNYDPQAGLEPLNGCDYSCDVVWYLTVSAAVFMDQWNIDYYHFFLKNENTSFGYLGAGTAYSYVPDCIPQLDASTLVETFSWQGNYDSSAGILQWEAWGDDGANILILDYESDEIVYPNECLAIGLSSKKLKAYKEENKKRKERAK